MNIFNNNQVGVGFFHWFLTTGRIQIKVLSTLPFFFFGCLVSKDKIYKSEMYNRWRINISFQVNIEIQIKKYNK